MKTAHITSQLRIDVFTCCALALLLTASVTFGQAVNPAVPEDEEIVHLSLFEVNTDKDYGYLKTNASTATRIGAEIQNVPMNISVMGIDFIRDTNIQTVTDVLRYTSSGSPDGGFRMARPANEATPQGNFTLRGFSLNSIMRNGVHRYVASNTDNLERIEIVKGPAAVYFGQGYPGGVINYITKKPQFAKVPATFSYQIDNEGGNRAVVDVNTQLGDKAAFRVTGGWRDLNGERRFEFENNLNFTTSLSLIPFKSKILRINLEFEYLKEEFNVNSGSWLYNDGWFQEYANPSAEMLAYKNMTADEYRARIFSSYTNWIADMRGLTGDSTMPAYTSVSPYGYYTDLDGNRVKDQEFNFTARGARSINEVKVFQGTVDFSPFPWFDIRYVFTKDNARFDNYEGTIVPNADGITFRVGGSTNGAANGYYRPKEDSQLDMLFKADAWGIKHKLLLGGVYSERMQYYGASAGAVFFQVPGYNYPSPPTGNLPNPAGQNGEVPVNQYLVNRNGDIMTANQVYNEWDPAIHPSPPIDKLHKIDRNILDGYRTIFKAWYVNWQADLLKDKLALFAGYRIEYQKGFGQDIVANDPWFDPPNTAYLDQVTYPPDVYNYSASYAGDPDGFRTKSGDSWMTGISYQITRDISVYASVSKTFKINTGIAGGYDELDIENVLQQALDHGGGQYVRNGRTITSVAEGLAQLQDEGADQELNNESGMNYEIGVKTRLWDNKLVSTFSLFRGVRTDQKLDDSQKQANAQEPFNYSTTMFPEYTYIDPDNPNNNIRSRYYNTRVLRWRTLGVENQITGAEFEIIWTPVRNYQAIVNGAWLWEAKTKSDPRYPKGSSAYADMYYGTRLENVPEFRFNMWHRYTVDKGALRKLNVSLGMRYSSETIVSRSWDYNPNAGGFTAGNYCIFDLSLSYPWEILGYRVTTTLGIQNLFDKTYYEGRTVPSAHRTWQIRADMIF